MIFTKIVIQKKLLKLAEIGIDCESPSDQIEVACSHNR